MAKITKRKIRWTASTAADLTNYKVYWETDADPDYNSTFVELPSTQTEVIIPDETTGFPVDVEGNYVFGITAVDDVGNESDMALTGTVPLDFFPPDPPTELVIENV